MGRDTGKERLTPRLEGSSLSYPLPKLARRRPRAYEEWSALERWRRLPEEEAMVVGFRLRQVRERAGISQTEMAERMGCSQQAVSQAERWQSNPTVRFIARWANAAGAELVLDLVCCDDCQGEDRSDGRDVVRQSS